ncbi:MAG TPA: hypothetical protein VHK69_21800 [Chitinophagaceae bacterium]|nr:hypothetical protein [Chitinophagaceae bacterium]
MCKVSADIQFCTCAADPDLLRDYWTWYRFHADQEDFVMGLVMRPPAIDPATDVYNREVLLARINTPEAWDAALTPAINDRLCVSLEAATEEGTGYVHYGFEFDGRQWNPCTFDLYAWLEKHRTSATGGLRPSPGPLP